jgi:hypothetical protein
MSLESDVLDIRRTVRAILSLLEQTLTTAQEATNTATATAAAATALAATQAEVVELLTALVEGESTSELALEELRQIRERLDLLVSKV